MMFPELDVDGLTWQCVYEIPMIGTEGVIEFEYIQRVLDRNVQLRVDQRTFIASEDMALAMTIAIRNANANYRSEK